MPGPESPQGHEGACLVRPGADQQLSSSLLDRAHCFSRVKKQIQQDLLQLNAISKNRKQHFRKPSLDRNAIPDGHTLRQTITSLIAALRSKRCFRGGAFLILLPDPIDDLSGSICVRNNAGERFPDLTQVRRLHLQKNSGQPWRC